MTSDGTYRRVVVMCERCDEVQVARRGPDGTVRLYTDGACPCGGTTFVDLTGGTRSRLHC